VASFREIIFWPHPPPHWGINKLSKKSRENREKILKVNCVKNVEFSTITSLFLIYAKFREKQGKNKIMDFVHWGNFLCIFRDFPI
jgi:hypothetical protein